MKQIKCILPNASELINGVKFEQVEDGMLSEPVEPEIAAHFARIPGYEITDASVPDEVPAKADKKAAKPATSKD